MEEPFFSNLVTAQIRPADRQDRDDLHAALEVEAYESITTVLRWSRDDYNAFGPLYFRACSRLTSSQRQVDRFCLVGSNHALFIIRNPPYLKATKGTDSSSIRNEGTSDGLAFLRQLSVSHSYVIDPKLMACQYFKRCTMWWNQESLSFVVQSVAPEFEPRAQVQIVFTRIGGDDQHLAVLWFSADAGARLLSVVDQLLRRASSSAAVGMEAHPIPAIVERPCEYVASSHASWATTWKHAWGAYRKGRPRAMTQLAAEAVDYSVTSSTLLEKKPEPTFERDGIRDAVLQDAPQSVTDVARIREKLVRWFSVEEPERLDHVDDMLQRYEGREDLLLLKVVAGASRQPSSAPRNLLSDDAVDDDDGGPDTSSDVDSVDVLEVEVALLERACDRISWEVSTGRISTTDAAHWNAAEALRVRTVNLGILVSRVCSRRIQSQHQTEEQAFITQNMQLQLEARRQQRDMHGKGKAALYIEDRHWL